MPLTSAYWPVPVACVVRSVLIGHAPSSREKSGSTDTDCAGAWNSSVRSKTAQKRDPRCKNVVDLDQDDQSDADPCRKYHAQQSRGGVERLRDQNASAHEHREVLRLEPGQLRFLPYFTSVNVVRVLGDRQIVGTLGDTSHLE